MQVRHYARRPISFLPYACSFIRRLVSNDEAHYSFQNVDPRLFQLLDDAIKIGGGIFGGWLIARTTLAREARKERLNKRFTLIEGILSDFESAHNAVTETVGTIKVTKATTGQLPNAEVTNQKLAPMRRDLSLAHAKLVLMNLPDAAESLSQYRRKMQELMKASLAGKSTDEITDEWANARVQFLDVLRQCFEAERA